MSVVGKEDDIRVFIERALQSQWQKVENLIDALPDRVLDRMVAEHSKGAYGKLHMMTQSRSDSIGPRLGVLAMPRGDSNVDWEDMDDNAENATTSGLKTVAEAQNTQNEKVTGFQADGERNPAGLQAPPAEKPKTQSAPELDDELKVDVRGMIENAKSVLTIFPEGGIQGYFASLKNDPNGFAHFVDGKVFSLISSVAILANTLYIGWETDTKMGNEVSRFSAGDQTLISAVPEYFFIIFFVIELLMRVVALKRLFLLGKDRNWNLFDFFLILLSFIQLVANTGSNLSVFRIFRIFRLARLLKVIRRVKVLESLNLMVFGIINCVIPLFWALMILVLVMYAFGVFFMSVSVSYLESRGEGDVTDTFMGELDLKFGSMYRSMCTLFEAISGGNDWAGLALELKTIGEGAYMCFALYIVFVTLGVLNIVTGFFVDGTISASADVKEELLKEAQEKKNALIELISELFHQMDEDKSGKLSLEELEDHLYDEDLQAYFTMLEMEPTEARDLFMLLDVRGEGEVGISDFTNGCLKVMGAPKNLDICTCLFQGKRIMTMMEKLSNGHQLKK